MNVIIDKKKVVSTLDHVNNLSQSYLIEDTVEKCNMMIDKLQDSKGEFVDELKIAIKKECDATVNFGRLIQCMTNYILRASESFSNVDDNYKDSKIN